MFKKLSCVLALLSVAWPARASNCEEIQAGIAERVRAGGIERFTLSTVDMEAEAPGRAVGRCDQGRKKIMLVQEANVAGAAPRRAPPPRRQETITECRDGTVVVGGGDCGR
jgi:hypothetical protein